jgi:hypothetical protein
MMLRDFGEHYTDSWWSDELLSTDGLLESNQKVIHPHFIYLRGKQLQDFMDSATSLLWVKRTKRSLVC